MSIKSKRIGGLNMIDVKFAVETKDGNWFENINSIELSKIMNTTSAQVRKDLSTFGEFGIRGKGYDIDKLIEIIEDILGINKVANVVIIGHGKMG